MYRAHLDLSAHSIAAAMGDLAGIEVVAALCASALVSYEYERWFLFRTLSAWWCSLTAASGPDRASPLILLADPSEQDRDMYAEYLLWRGFRVALSDNSVEALTMAFELRPDLVCTSFVLGEQTGVALCAALNADERTRHIPVIIMTTRTTDADLENVRSSGCQAVLIKPCLPNVLATQAKRLIKASHRPPGGPHRPAARGVRAPVSLAAPRPSRRS